MQAEHATSLVRLPEFMYKAISVVTAIGLAVAFPDQGTSKSCVNKQVIPRKMPVL